MTDQNQNTGNNPNPQFPFNQPSTTSPSIFGSSTTLFGSTGGFSTPSQTRSFQPAANTSPGVFSTSAFASFSTGVSHPPTQFGFGQPSTGGSLFPSASTGNSIIPSGVFRPVSTSSPSPSWLSPSGGGNRPTTFHPVSQPSSGSSPSNLFSSQANWTGGGFTGLQSSMFTTSQAQLTSFGPSLTSTSAVIATQSLSFNQWNSGSSFLQTGSGPSTTFLSTSSPPNVSLPILSSPTVLPPASSPAATSSPPVTSPVSSPPPTRTAFSPASTPTSASEIIPASMAVSTPASTPSTIVPISQPATSAVEAPRLSEFADINGVLGKTIPLAPVYEEDYNFFADRLSERDVIILKRRHSIEDTYRQFMTLQAKKEYWDSQLDYIDGQYEKMNNEVNVIIQSVKRARINDWSFGGNVTQDCGKLYDGLLKTNADFTEMEDKLEQISKMRLPLRQEEVMSKIPTMAQIEHLMLEIERLEKRRVKLQDRLKKSSS